MSETCLSHFPSSDIAVMAAAVADYTPVNVSSNKIKKKEEVFTIELTRTTDILANLGAQKTEKQVLAGFALETENEQENALKKLAEKNADLIVLNTLKEPLAGFGKDTNKITVFDRNGSVYYYDAKSKQLVANDIVELIIKKRNEKL
jgi:phosphopantothenoylcysteine decarboxylase/phosphopantothenate--cysteine ligase